MTKKEYWTDIFTPQRLWAVFFIQLNEGYQMNAILPFVVFMIRDFGFSENSVGVYAGLLTATFALCQFLSSYFWGWFSDYKGRKIALLLGLGVSGVAIIIFGFSKTYAQAIAARMLAGIFNGNIGVARAYIADITDSTNRAFAFSIFAIAFSGGIILGSTAGGVLIHSYELHEDGTHTPSESVLRFWIFEYEYPYLPPCIIGACISLLSFTLCAMYVQEDRKGAVVANGKHGKNNYTEFADDDIATGEQSSSRSLPMMSIGGISAKRSAMTESTNDDMVITANSMTRDELMDTSLQTSLVDANVHGTATSALHDVVKAFKTFTAEKSKLLADDDEDSNVDTEIRTLGDLFAKTKLLHALITNSTMMLMLVTWNAMVPLLMAQTLGFDSTEIGIQMAFCGVVLFAFTWWIQPPLLKRYNYKLMYVVMGSMMVCVIILFPSVAVIPNVTDWNKWLLLVVVSILGSFKFALSTNMVVTSFCFINNSVPTHMLGRANGLGQACAAGLRGLGPLVGGVLWSWSMTVDSAFSVYIAYLFMAVPTTLSVIHCWIFIEHDIQIVYEERMEMKKADKT